MTKDEKLKNYMSNILSQLKGMFVGFSRCWINSSPDWLVVGSIQRLVLVVTSIQTKQVLERWSFDIETSQKGKENMYKNPFTTAPDPFQNVKQAYERN